MPSLSPRALPNMKCYVFSHFLRNTPVMAESGVLPCEIKRKIPLASH